MKEYQKRQDYPAPHAPPVATYTCTCCADEETEENMYWAQVNDIPEKWDWICQVCAENGFNEEGLLTTDLTIEDYLQEEAVAD